MSFQMKLKKEIYTVDIFLIVVGILCFLAGIVLFIYSVYQKQSISYAEGAEKSKRAGSFFAIGIGLIVFVLGCSITIVPTGYTGVRITMGQISNTVVPQGLNFKIPFVEQITLINNKQQDINFGGQVWGEANDQTPVYASDIIVTYQINGERSSWICANVSQLDEGLVDENLVASAIKSAMKELSPTDVTNRSKIEPLVKDKLNESLAEKYGDDTVNVLKVVVNNMDFEEGYNEAIAQKSQAQQEYETQQIQNETTVARAEAEAEARRIEAQAEADANALIANSVTEGVLQSKFYDTWDGVLPQVMGDNAVITDISQTAE